MASAINKENIAPLADGRRPRMSAAEQILAASRLWMKRHPGSVLPKRPAKIRGTPEEVAYEAAARAERQSLTRFAHTCGAVALASEVTPV